jgi:AraC-like DNA-binding protein/quercetin dioxygenase-like cupin family protein
MASDKITYDDGPEGHHLPSPKSITVKVIQLAELTAFPMERHAWGQFVYSLKGVIELTVKSSRYAAPPDFGVWLPPETDHLARAADDTSYFLLDIDENLCGRLPKEACILAVGNIAKAILLDLKERGGVSAPENDDDNRLMRVLVDQLSVGAKLDNFLPLSDDRALKLVLEKLCKDPGDSRSLEEWARYVNCTERTLARRCKRDLGMTFLKWRQRLRISRAIAMLSDGHSVQTVAQKLGYSTTSAFIVMFQGSTGVTPNTFRSRLKGSQ